MKRALAISILLFCSYLIGISFGLPSKETSRLIPLTDTEIQQLVGERERLLDGYSGDGKLYRNNSDFIRSYFLGSSSLDSNKLMGTLGELASKGLKGRVGFHYGLFYFGSLGGYLYCLDKIGIVNLVGDVSYYLKHPEETGKLFLASRVFIALSVALTAFFLFFLARCYLGTNLAYLAMLLYGLNPYVFVYAHDIKPWVFANVFLIPALYLAHKEKTLWAGLLMGLSAGCMALNMLGLVYFIGRKKWIYACILACGVFIISNPHLFMSNQVTFNIKNYNTFYAGGFADFFSFIPRWVYIFGPLILMSWTRLDRLTITFTAFIILLTCLGYERAFTQCMAIAPLLYLRSLFTCKLRDSSGSMLKRQRLW